MPIKTAKFKSDKEIEDELRNPRLFAGKVRRYDPLDHDNRRDCYLCSNLIRPSCKVGFPNTFGLPPCGLQCPIYLYEKTAFEYCDHYEPPKCKEGFPVSATPMSCPKYDGPKPLPDKWRFIGESKP